MIIKITDLQLKCSIGVYESEKVAKRKILVTIELQTTYNCNDDDIKTATNYDKIVEVVKAVCNAKHYNLLETLCVGMGEEVLASFNQIKTCTIEIKKPHAILNAAMVSVKKSFEK